MRFVPDFCIQIDATFNTNRAALLLGVFTGVANTGKGFPVVYSLIKSESAENWLFMLTVVANNYLKGLRMPKVILSNRGKGLTAAIPDSPFYAVVQQYCQWHAAKNIKERINNSARREATAVTAAAKARLATVAAAATNLQAGYAALIDTAGPSTQASEVLVTAPKPRSTRKLGYTAEEKETLNRLVWL
ncbi:unnamed protein product [Zymoseptoria tritici ST99CH_1A5]|uniref:MULE transposase domain-containing protein n=1 Tax=Zymoseptoria tritici ST99CH_1A5 TaxID=1276529 RepID=A0A1Y6LZ28_ZYMTR|nr:unnamed protein product [Zymoseptoria tritici ST99CH_1A5]